MRHKSAAMNNSSATSLFTPNLNVNLRLVHELTWYTRVHIINSCENDEIQSWINIKAREVNLVRLTLKQVSFNFPSLDTSWTIIHGGYLLKGQTQTPFLFSYFERVTMTDWFIFCKGKNWCSWPINKRFISLALLTQVVHVKDQNLVVYTAAVFHVQGAKLSGACQLKSQVFFFRKKKMWFYYETSRSYFMSNQMMEKSHNLIGTTRTNLVRSE